MAEIKNIKILNSSGNYDEYDISGDGAEVVDYETFASYDDSKKNDGTTYYVYDAKDIISANDVTYSNVTSALSATNVQSAIDSLNSSKISISNIIDNLTSTNTNKPLSANQGKVLKGLIDEKVSTSGSILNYLITPTLTSTSSVRFYFVPKISYAVIETTHTTNLYLEELLKWICKNYSGVSDGVFFTNCCPNSQGFAMMQIYNTSLVDSNGLPQYASGMYIPLGGSIILFGTTSYTYYCTTK